MADTSSSNRRRGELKRSRRSPPGIDEGRDVSRRQDSQHKHLKTSSTSRTRTEYARRSDDHRQLSPKRSGRKPYHVSGRHSYRQSYDNRDDERYRKSNVNKLLKDLESSSSSGSEGEINETTPTASSKSENVQEEANKVIKKTWRDISDSEEEEEVEEKDIKEVEDVSNEQEEEEEEIGPEMVEEVIADTEVNDEVEKSDTPVTEGVKDELETSLQPESMEIVSPESDQSIELLPMYLPGLMGCRSVENYEWLNKIEEGTYGVVFRGKDKKTGEIVALKKLKMEKEREGFPITSLREINMLLKAKHENIVHVREIVVGSNMDKIFIVMDYIEHDLKSLMETMKQPFLEGEIKTLMIQLLRAVHHLHDNWILHRDLKTSNLLFSHKGILKVADFGLAREYGSPLKSYTPIVVTLWYRAPELLLEAKEYSTAIDVWSVGCIFAELLQHKPLFMGKSENDQLNQIFKELGTPNDSIWPGFSKLPVAKKVQFISQPLNNLRKRFPHISKNGFNLLNKFFAYDPQRRVTADEALKQDYFEETPLPVDPQMFPTWPAKSEIIKKTIRAKSPTAPEGGAFLLNSKLKDDDITIEGQSAVGPTFTLKF